MLTVFDQFIKIFFDQCPKPLTEVFKIMTVRIFLGSYNEAENDTFIPVITAFMYITLDYKNNPVHRP